MTPQYTEASIGTFYWVLPEAKPWSLSTMDDYPQFTPS